MNQKNQKYITVKPNEQEETKRKKPRFFLFGQEVHISFIRLSEDELLPNIHLEETDYCECPYTTKCSYDYFNTRKIDIILFSNYKAKLYTIILSDKHSQKVRNKFINKDAFLRIPTLYINRAVLLLI
ncbi:MAG: hypothetical protein GYA14_12925 [Ignavibacteria bacterium]|nr:hypothetical protein [Ignavibacteria bacterium]